MQSRATCWSLTINNPTETDDENMAQARQKGWKVEGQKEVGKNGTPHYQLMLQTPQVRLSAVKKAFPRAHIEIARSKFALETYVNKEETRVSQLPQSNEQYPSMSKVWELYIEWMFDKNIIYRVEPTEDNPRSYRIQPSHTRTMMENPTQIWDDFISHAITNGYYVESIGVNPQIRSSVKNYSLAIIEREVRRQTDRQTDSQSAAESLVEINLPEIHNNGGQDQVYEEGS